mgnify:CR=1 FL=1
MPVSGLPLSLEKALEALSEGSHLTSWNIRGGKFTTVTLRFRDQDGHLDKQLSSTPRSYRSKPPSAVRRDSVRKQDWFTRKLSENMHSSNVAERSEFTQTDEADLIDSRYIDSSKMCASNYANEHVDGCEQACASVHDIRFGDISFKTDPVVTKNNSDSTMHSKCSKEVCTLKSHMTFIHKNTSNVQGPKNTCKQSNIKERKSHAEISKQLFAEDILNWQTVPFTTGESMCDQCLRKLEDSELIKQCTCVERRRICWLCIYSHGEPYCHDCKGSDVGGWISETDTGGYSDDDHGIDGKLNQTI